MRSDVMLSEAVVSWFISELSAGDIVFAGAVIGGVAVSGVVGGATETGGVVGGGEAVVIGGAVGGGAVVVGRLVVDDVATVTVGAVAASFGFWLPDPASAATSRRATATPPARSQGHSRPCPAGSDAGDGSCGAGPGYHLPSEANQ